jgi:ribosome-associated translation inhibitor RaiA
MTDVPAVAVRFKDLDPDEAVRQRVEKRCAALTGEFPETTHVEVTFEPEGDLFHAHGRVLGKRTEAATSASATELSPAADRLFERLAKQLRRAHDKRIFTHRREAMQQNPKKKPQT